MISLGDFPPVISPLTLKPPITSILCRRTGSTGCLRLILYCLGWAGSTSELFPWRGVIAILEWMKRMSYLKKEIDLFRSTEVREVSPVFQMSSSCIRVALADLLFDHWRQSAVIINLDTTNISWQWQVLTTRFYGNDCFASVTPQYTLITMLIMLLYSNHYANHVTIL